MVLLKKYKYNIGRRKEHIIRIRVDSKLLYKIKKVANEKGYTMSELIRKAIILLLANEVL